MYSRTLIISALIAVLCAGAAVAGEPSSASGGALVGQISSASQPLPFSKVFAYHLSDQRLERVITDGAGTFEFARLRAGLYKIIAFQDGFVPAVALLTRSTSEAIQYLDMQLSKREAAADDGEDDFWAVRDRVPADVLREIQAPAAVEEAVEKDFLASTWLDTRQMETRMEALAGLDENAELGSASMAGGRVGVEGEIASLSVGLNGDYVALMSTPGLASAGDPSGRTQALSLSLESGETVGVRVSTTNNYMTRPGVEGLATDVGLERHRVAWSQSLGAYGKSDFSAEYAAENNFFREAPIEPFGIPEASKSWRVEGSYTAALNERSTVQTGFRYREREAIFEVETRHARESFNYLPAQRVDLFGRGGLQVNPDVLVEFGMYSTMRDGSLSLAPTGGMAVRLGRGWRAQASGSVRVHSEVVDTLHPDFTPVLFSEYDQCQTAEEYCYRLSLEKTSGEQRDLSLGVVHRKFAETLHLYFNDDFFNRLESMYLVRGDNLPELQFEATRRLSPRILAHLASSVASGGGGILYATDQSSYENEVRYLVTSLDTQFEQTSTGVFLAFHHLAQQLNPVRESPDSTAAPEMELERLQLMLTQDLDVLQLLASNWAVHLNMEVSRSNGPQSEALATDDELRKRVMGGLTVSF